MARSAPEISALTLAHQPCGLVAHLRRGGGAAQVGSEDAALFQASGHGAVDAGGGFRLAQVVEHHGNGGDSGDGVGDALAHYVEGCAVHRLEQRRVTCRG